MKRLKSSLLVILTILLLVCGCRKDDPVEPDNPNPPEISEEEKITKNLEIENIGTIIGEYSHKFSLVKITNKNDCDVYLEVKYNYFNNNEQVDGDSVYVYVGSNKSVYSVSKMYSEDPDFNSYQYEVSFINKIEDYNDIINNIDLSYNKTSKDIVVTMKNNGSRTTTVKALLLFYSGDKIVAVSESTQYNLVPGKSGSESISLPYKKANTLIPFDRVMVFVNEVSIRL